MEEVGKEWGSVLGCGRSEGRRRGSGNYEGDVEECMG